MTDEVVGNQLTVSPLAAIDEGSGQNGPIGQRRLRAVVLDWAGTIQDCGSRAPVAAFIELFGHFGIEITVAQARAPMGMFKKDHIRAIGSDADVARSWQRHHLRPFTEDDVAEMYLALGAIQEDILPAYGELIEGTLEAAEQIRARGYRVGSTTGYPRSAGSIAAACAIRQGFAADVMICADEVPAGRPEPWMLLRAMEALRVYPPSAVVKVGDTKVDIGEALNAGAWAVGVSRTGNYVGLSEEEAAATPPAELEVAVAAAAETLRREGAHYVIESIADLPAVLDEIEVWLANGDRP
jgi:phosphonoacetaldehyde hydrolase